MIDNGFELCLYVFVFNKGVVNKSEVSPVRILCISYSSMRKVSYYNPLPCPTIHWSFCDRPCVQNKNMAWTFGRTTLFTSWCWGGRPPQSLYHIWWVWIKNFCSHFVCLSFYCYKTVHSSKMHHLNTKKPQLKQPPTFLYKSDSTHLHWSPTKYKKLQGEKPLIECGLQLTSKLILAITLHSTTSEVLEVY